MQTSIGFIGILATVAACGIDDVPEGLGLEANDAERAAGTFTRDGATVAFDLTRDGAAEHLVLTTADGLPLIDARIEDDGSHVTSVLGGRLVVTLTDGTELAYEGDRTAMDELGAMPEAAALAGLEPELMTASVAHDLLPSKSMHVRAKDATTQSYYPDYACGTIIGPRSTVTCGTWFLGWTELYLRNYSFSAVIVERLDTLTSPYYLWPRSYYYAYQYDMSGWWWGRNVIAYDGGVCPAHYPCGGAVRSYAMANNDVAVQLTHW